MTMKLAALAMIAACGVQAQQPGTKPPQPLLRPEPKYSDEAWKLRLQGDVLVMLTVDELGRPGQIRILRPLGFGLDEKAIEAVGGWTFVPAEKDGKAVPFGATILVSFRIKGRIKVEEWAKRLADSLIQLRGDERAHRQAAKTIADLAKDKYPPAMYVHSQILRQNGDVTGADDWNQRAADALSGAAIYYLAARLKAENGDPKRVNELLERAAYLGSPEAQIEIGASYEDGTNGFTRSREKAEWNYRLCAARGYAACQYKLGQLIVDRSKTEAVAWLELAISGQMQPRALEDAARILSAVRGELTAEQIVQSQRLKPLLVHQPLAKQ